MIDLNCSLLHCKCLSLPHGFSRTEQCSVNLSWCLMMDLSRATRNGTANDSLSEFWQSLAVGPNQGGSSLPSPAAISGSRYPVAVLGCSSRPANGGTLRWCQYSNQERWDTNKRRELVTAGSRIIDPMCPSICPRGTLGSDRGHT